MNMVFIPRSLVLRSIVQFRLKIGVFNMYCPRHERRSEKGCRSRLPRLDRLFCDQMSGDWSQVSVRHYFLHLNNRNSKRKFAGHTGHSERHC